MAATIHRLDPGDVAGSLTLIADQLAGNLVRFTVLDGGHVTAVVVGATLIDGQLEVLIDLVVTDEGEHIPADATLAWSTLTSAQIVDTGHVAPSARRVLLSDVVAAMQRPTTAVQLVAGDGITAHLAGFSTELVDDVTLFLRLDHRHGPDVAGRFAVVRWSELAHLTTDPERPRP